jgi:hypothetical protein
VERHGYATDGGVPSGDDPTVQKALGVAAQATPGMGHNQPPAPKSASHLPKGVSPEDALMIFHNTRLDRLQGADQLGGFAVPSLAITKPQHGFNNFGDITLIAHPSMISGDKKVPVFASDVYSPRFPSLNDEGTKIFKGYTYSGKRRYLPLTLENVVKEMKGNIRGGEGGNFGGAGMVRSSVVPKFKNFAEIQKNRNKIVNENDFNEMRKQTNEKLWNLSNEFHPYYNYSADEIQHAREFSGSLKEAGQRGHFMGMTPDYNNLPPELLSKARNFLHELRNMPTTYFEAKPQRAVSIGEFHGALVPHDIYHEVAPILQKHGVQRIFPYHKDDTSSKANALNQFSDLTFKAGGLVPMKNDININHQHKSGEAIENTPHEDITPALALTRRYARG